LPLGTDLNTLKKEAAERAVEYIRDGMIVGLGTGSTTQFALQKIGELVQQGVFKNIKGIPSSQHTEQKALSLKIPLTNLNEHPQIDLTIDGADEIDPQLNLIKGGGGALLREKIIAQASKRVIIIADESKLSPQLGTKFALPVEVIEFGLKPTIQYLESLGAKVTKRVNNSGRLFRTDEGNLILDCDFGAIANPSELAINLNKQAAIVENGLFLGIAYEAIIAGMDGVQHLKR
jgi:ribose 5-phosphate isomerase A